MLAVKIFHALQIFACLLLAGGACPSFGAELMVTVNASNSQWQISPYLVGLHQVYSALPDTVYTNGAIAAWAKRVGVSTSRFPGGTVVKYWDWEEE